MNLVKINQEVQFSAEDANQLLPVIYRWTKDAHNKVEGMMNQLESISTDQPSVTTRRLEIEIDRSIINWQSKIQKIGAKPRGLWRVDFDSGDGFWCWEYPARTVQFWRGYGQSVEQS